MQSLTRVPLPTMQRPAITALNGRAGFEHAVLPGVKTGLNVVPRDAASQNGIISAVESAAVTADADHGQIGQVRTIRWQIDAREDPVPQRSVADGDVRQSVRRHDGLFTLAIAVQ